ncbi:uncharacterized protein LOC110987250 isoform X2 [Acanthaster planci]|uniref:Uncharacterized protein LOC110987250 isoform X2 n=1 Tax=Acanthaster planci TaxID=133434 RepID=A0A8B7ZKF5_ACAPL|nr:uncharacterized protein LOC110987250 isoform X2 [Acanthaster planci]
MSAENLLQMEEGDDDYPLLPLQRGSGTRQSFTQLRQKQRARRVNVGVTEADIMMEEEGYYDDDLEAKYMATFSRRQKRQTMLVLHDALFLVLDFLQFYALLAAISLRWPWPFNWLYPTRFLFLANLDVWEFMKMNDPEVYNSARNNFIDSTLIGFDYRWYTLGWAIFIFVAITLYIILYIAMNYQKRYNLLLQVARLQRAYIILCQVLAMPIGVMMAKLFHCNADDNMDVHNATPCAGGEHLAYVVPSLAIYVGLFIILPIWMIMKIRTQIFSNRSERHEGFLQLKETEFSHGLDFIWAIKLYHLFSSFRLVWAYYRPVMFLFKLVLLASYAALLWLPMWQMIVFLVAICPLFLVILIRRPFRITSFNVYIMINFLCMLILAIMGLMQNLFDTNSVFFQAEYLFSELLAVGAFWAVFTVVWFVYVLLRYYGLLCRGVPLWPEMTSREVNKLSGETQKYMRALLKGRIVLEHALSTCPLFSPVHELSRQIQIINAYCREAEYLHDPIHDTLWDLLDELIEAHTHLSPVSLFSESVKSSIRETAHEFMKLMPAFKKRLAQREYDFILMTPMKRRMLLKMFTLGVFANGKMNKPRPVDQTETVQRLYNPRESVVLQQRGVEGDDGFYEDMYDSLHDLDPSTLRLKQQQQYKARMMRRPILEEMSEDEDVDADADEDSEVEWMRGIPSRAESDLVSSINDRDADDLSDMMAGIPSRPGSISSSSRSVSRHVYQR